MAEYVQRARSERSASARSVVSVGEMIEGNQLYSSSHPMYQQYTDLLRRNLAITVARATEKKNVAQQAVCTVSIAPEDREAVARDYPEFRVIWPNWVQPVHAEWRAQRQLANQYMAHHMRKYVTSFVHYGGGALDYLTLGLDEVTLKVNHASAVAVHESFDDDLACGRLSGAPAQLATGLGWTVDIERLERYNRRELFEKSNSANRDREVGQALIVDGSLYAMSPQQFMAAMVQHKSDVGMFAFPYHPSMLMQDQGVLPATDVAYELDAEQILFKYPEGVSGVVRYSASVWHQWLVNTIRELPDTRNVSYQFELMGVRGALMFVQVVRIAASAPAGQHFVHSLQLPNASGMTLVRTWRLRALTSRVEDPSSWEHVSVTVPTRVVEKTVEYAMALDADQFSRHAIRKRLAVTNDRVVVQGTSVEVHEAMRSADLDVLEIAIFTHCFVARYESGRVAARLRKALDQFASFGKLGVLERMSRIMFVTVSMAYDWTFGAVDDVLRSAFDRFRVWIGAMPRPKRSDFEPAPQFLRYDTIVERASRGFFSGLRRALTVGCSMVDLNIHMPGFDYLVFLSGKFESAAPSVPVLDLDVEVSRNGVDVFCDIVDTSVGAEATEASARFVKLVGESNALDLASQSRHYVEVFTETEGSHAVDMDRDDYSFDPGYIDTLDDFHDAIVPNMRGVDFKYDATSISVDDQDRSLAAEYLQLPLDYGQVPKSTEVFVSRLQAYNITKRPMTTQETLSAAHARNLSAPVLALPQNEGQLIQQVIDDFLDIACVSDARQKLEQFQRDPIGLEEQAMTDWFTRATSQTQMKVVQYLLDNPTAYEELETWRYEAMIKTDVKPPLSDKPFLNRVEPQLIVHHLGIVNAIYSSVLRVLVRRFVSLLKPNFFLNLLKDMPQVRDKIQVFHAWGEKLTFLENDFSKYDKSQGEFVHRLEMTMFELLGMNHNMLKHWEHGHVNCNIHSVTAGISLKVRFQRKSGDASTSFGNGMLNIMSVVHAYKGSEIVWAVFIGDDSLVAVRSLIAPELAVMALGEKFNLQAKFFVTTSPYFASNFILFQEESRRVVCVPDPLKRVEKWSMAVNAREPDWDGRYQSAVDSLAVYRQRANLIGLGRAVYERYGTHGGVDFDAVGDAIASVIRSPKDFRSLWEPESQVISF